MPAPKNLLNGFTPEDVTEITDISEDMLNYLRRHGYLDPAYGRARKGRGLVRYFSYRDLVIASAVQHLRESGVKLAKLKAAIRFLHQDQAWFPSRRSKPIQWLVSDGKEVLMKNDDGFLDQLRPGGQRAFAFIVNLGGLQEEVKRKIERKKLRHFSIENRPLLFEKGRRKSKR